MMKVSANKKPFIQMETVNLILPEKNQLIILLDVIFTRKKIKEKPKLISVNFVTKINFFHIGIKMINAPRLKWF